MTPVRPGFTKVSPVFVKTTPDTAGLSPEVLTMITRHSDSPQKLYAKADQQATAGGGRKIATRTLAFCLQTAFYISLFYIPLQAKIHDYSIQDLGTVRDADQYDGPQGKTIQVVNHSTQKIYVRIGYVSLFGTDCDFTGFILNPGQMGAVYKNQHCVPINITGTFITQDGKKIKDIPHGIKSTWINDEGILRWNVYDIQGIQYTGFWNGHHWKKQKKHYEPY